MAIVTSTTGFEWSAKGRASFVAVIAVGLAACSVGSGSGSATGPLHISYCNGNSDLGSAADPYSYSLQPHFFAGEPIEDIGMGRKYQRLIIRMQREGGDIDTTDSLVFDIPDSYEVARCLRGRTVNGVPDYDDEACLVYPDGHARLRVGDLDHVRAYFTPFDTCRSTMSSGGPSLRTITGVAVSTTDGGTPDALVDAGSAEITAPSWSSWIDLVSFGGAVTTAPNDERDAIPLDFKIDFGQRIQASAFHLTLQDDRVLQAAKDMVPAEASQIAGTLDGFFDFDLERSRAAQTFP